jgi:S-DNA-T family DNA segregation ATPase FtsK/SpoIIIE
MIFIGFSTLLSLLSINHDTSTGGWLAFLDETFGWGAYLFPLALIAVGLWLILRNFERVPHISLERLFGIGLLYGNLLAVFHYLGQGGGLLGRGLFSALQFALGVGGAVIALLAWLVIALTLTLDVSVADLFRWVPPLVMRLQDVWDDFRTRNGEAIPKRPSTQGGQPAKGSSLTGPPGAAVPSGVATAAGLHPFTPVPVGQPRAWVLPSLDEILEPGLDVTYDDEIDRQRARIIEETLASFGAPVNVIEINRGPTITQFGVEPDFIETRTGRMRVRVGKIATLADDLALALSARTIRVQAPVPGKGYVGIEVPNEQIAMVALRDVLESEALTRLKSPLRFALGQDVAGNAVAAGLDSMPHLLIAGATGSGKSVCVNALITCLLLNNTPDDLRLIMVDPKRVELTGYNGIPHLLSPVVVEMERVVGALQWVLREMDARYHKLAELGTRNINEYNARLESRGGKKLPRLVVFIDELADLMMLAPDETERSLTRLAQLARATGIHLVIATQRPSVDVVTGVIKANFPARVAFAVASGTDSRVILDQPGAERLLGRGDMLFQAPDAPAPIRIQGAFVSDVEIQRLVQYWQSFAGAQPVAPASVGGVVDALPPGIPLKQMSFFEEAAADSGDPLLNEAIDLARRQGRASITMLQRRLRIGYTRAARLIETMQERKIVSANSGPQGFEILDYGPAASPVEEQRG